MVLFRYRWNGETRPDFVDDQNPAGFARDRFTRVTSVAWVHVLYLRDALAPRDLGPDWSGLGIDLIRTWSDPRLLVVLALWIMAAGVVRSLCCGGDASSSVSIQQRRRVGLVAVIAFMFLPFLLSSNLLVVVGLMKADRGTKKYITGRRSCPALLCSALCALFSVC